MDYRSVEGGRICSGGVDQGLEIRAVARYEHEDSRGHFGRISGGEDVFANGYWWGRVGKSGRLLIFLSPEDTGSGDVRLATESMVYDAL